MTAAKQRYIQYKLWQILVFKLHLKNIHQMTTKLN